VGVIVGFILGFFVSQASVSSGLPGTVDQASAALPENHPSPEVMERLQQMLEQVKSEPENLQLLVGLGNTYYDMGRFDAAIPWYEKAWKLGDQDVAVSTDLGTAYLYTGKIDEAVKQYQLSLSIEPDHPQTLQNLGIAYFSNGNYQGAVDVWERLIATHPEYPHAEELKKQIETARSHLDIDSASK